jgi:hypothetical protein
VVVVVVVLIPMVCICLQLLAILWPGQQCSCYDEPEVGNGELG